MASSNRPPVQQEREVGHVSTSEVAGLPVWASKPGRGRFTCLVLKIGVRPDGGDGGHVASSRSLCQSEAKL